MMLRQRGKNIVARLKSLWWSSYALFFLMIFADRGKDMRIGENLITKGNYLSPL